MNTPSTESSPVVLYDGSLGGTPSTQGRLVYRASSSTSAQESHADGATTLDTTPSQADMAGYFANPASVPTLDRSAGYTLSFTVQVVSEFHDESDKNGDGIGDRAGFSVILLSSDTKGIELGFWEDQIWAQEDGAAEPPAGTLFTHAEGAAFDATAGLMDYTLAIHGDTYHLSSSGSAILSGRLRDYTAFEWPMQPYQTPNFIFLGDNTSTAKARIRLSYVAVQ